MRFETARRLGAMLAVAVGVRVALGGWGLRDCVVGAALVASQPFTEWLVHVYILHFTPREVFGRHVDLGVADGADAGGRLRLSVGARGAVGGRSVQPGAPPHAW